MPGFHLDLDVLARWLVGHGYALERFRSGPWGSIHVFRRRQLRVRLRASRLAAAVDVSTASIGEWFELLPASPTSAGPRAEPAVSAESFAALLAERTRALELIEARHEAARTLRPVRRRRPPACRPRRRDSPE